MSQALVADGGSVFGVRGVWPLVIAPNAEVMVELTVFPALASARVRSTLMLRTDDPAASTVTIALSGTGLEHVAVFTPPPLDFGEVYAGESKRLDFTMLNAGSAPLPVIGASTGDAGFTLAGFSFGTLASGAQISGDDLELAVEAQDEPKHALKPYPQALRELTAVAEAANFDEKAVEPATQTWKAFRADFESAAFAIHSVNPLRLMLKPNDQGTKGGEWQKWSLLESHQFAQWCLTEGASRARWRWRRSTSCKTCSRCRRPSSASHRRHARHGFNGSM